MVRDEYPVGVEEVGQGFVRNNESTYSSTIGLCGFFHRFGLMSFINSSACMPSAKLPKYTSFLARDGAVKDVKFALPKFVACRRMLGSVAYVLRHRV